MADHEPDDSRAQRNLDMPTDPNGTGTDPDRDPAALLAGLGGVTPPPEVKTTSGQRYAAAAVPPHKPPKAHEVTHEEEGVIVNQTDPLEETAEAAAPSPAPRPSFDSEPTTPNAPRIRIPSPQLTTFPGETKVRKRRGSFIAILGIAVGVGGAAAAIGLSLGSTPPPSAAARPPETASTSVPSLTAASEERPAPFVPAPVPPPRDSAVVVVAPSPRPSVRVAPRSSAPRTTPSGSFVEPDRTF